MSKNINIIDELKNKITNFNDNKYLKQLIYKKNISKENNFVFEAPNKFIANYIKTKYHSLIKDIIKEKFDIDPTIEIRITGQRKKTKKEISLNEINNSSETVLNPSYTFDSFVVGSSNQMAYNAAKAISQKLGILYNPLFIYGGSGLGKTHLIQAIGNYVAELNKNIIYVTSEQFVNAFTFSLKNNTIENFRQTYRNCDLLLIDDVQFLSGKEKTQEELFHTFNELKSSNKQIVLTADKLPSQIAGLEDRLKSRFEWGLTCDVQIPELETKIAIVEKKCELNGINLSKDIINYIASNLGSSVREIEGLLIKINASADLLGQEITLELVKNLLKEQIAEQKSNIKLPDIIDAVSKELNIKPSDLKSNKRNHKIVNARRIVIYLARELTHNSMPDIAKFLGMKDHSSVSKNISKASELLQKDENFKLTLQNLKNKILNDKGL